MRKEAWLKARCDFKQQWGKPSLTIIVSTALVGDVGIIQLLLEEMLCLIVILRENEAPRNGKCLGSVRKLTCL